MSSLYEDDQKAVQQAVMAAVPKAVHQILNDSTLFAKQTTTSATTIVQQAVQHVVQEKPEVQAAIQNFNQRHPDKPYDTASFGKTPEIATPKQAITTQFTRTQAHATPTPAKQPTLAPEAETPTSHKKLR